jgi:hypothetical protein
MFGPWRFRASSRRGTLQCTVLSSAPAMLLHEFLLLDRELDDYVSEYPRDDPGALHLHDDVLGPLLETLAFIPTHNPCRRERQHGLNRHGLTLIRNDGAAVAERVFRAWGDLYAAGPPQFTLVGASFAAPEEPEEGDDGSWPPYDIGVGVAHWHVVDERGNGYMRLVIDRDPLVAILHRLAAWSGRVAADERLVLLHGGI